MLEGVGARRSEIKHEVALPETQKQKSPRPNGGGDFCNYLAILEEVLEEVPEAMEDRGIGYCSRIRCTIGIRSTNNRVGFTRCNR